MNINETKTFETTMEYEFRGEGYDKGSLSSEFLECFDNLEEGFYKISFEHECDEQLWIERISKEQYEAEKEDLEESRYIPGTSIDQFSGAFMMSEGFGTSIDGPQNGVGYLFQTTDFTDNGNGCGDYKFLKQVG